MMISAKRSALHIFFFTLLALQGAAQKRQVFIQSDTGGLRARWELDDAHRNGTFLFTGYKPIYVLPVNWTTDRNVMPKSDNPNNTVPDTLDLDAAELKFQLSFKTKIAQGLFWGHGDVWAAYTQTSRWQLYNAAVSRPFRETNYEPEFMLVFATPFRFLGGDMRMMGVGINHQSNGRAQPLSRSWNRVIFQIGWERRNWMVVARPWFRVQEPDSEDDNPGIENYIGRGDLVVTYTRGAHQLSFTGRHSLRLGDDNRGSLGIDWAMRIRGNLRGHVQLFNGYGESMIDYNHRQTTIGVGLSLAEW